ncbi:hypothetical protein E4U42_002978 [Claviceps africana]|uniref:FAD dependent oxidoreductase domain-containing protein n=1 Tax=Claviceps africana TaxID=83212 RepID=A0A8K0NJ71_9HYPO|nr:hypothetical protein E4U42_002978 [Claviceps africana]
MEGRRNIVIVGGGIIGCTTAYYLTRHPKFNPALHTITLLEAGSSLAAGASGKAGGLLALWAYPACIVPLSYQLHQALAAEHDGPRRWGYRKLHCGSIEAVISKQTLLDATRQGQDKDGKVWEKLPKQDAAAKELLQEESLLPRDLDWVNRDLITSWAEMGAPGTTETAQAHPLHFTTAIGQLAQEAGVQMKMECKVCKIVTSKTSLDKIEYLDRKTGEMRELTDLTDVVVTAGPWTGKLLPRSKVEGLRAHSVVYEADVSPFAVFTNVRLPSDFVPEHRAKLGQKRMHKNHVDPEIYARPFGEAYACGEPDTTIPLPDTVDEVECDEAQCDDIISYIKTFSPVLGSAPIKTKQSCYMPRHMRFGQESGPLIGPTTVQGLWVAAGHTCWGIQNGPATGKLMSEYLFDGAATSANIEKLDPRKFRV